VGLIRRTSSDQLKNNKGATTMKKAVFLFDYTGIMAKPWADAGYLCYCFDGQHPLGVSKSDHPNILNVGMWFSNNLTSDFFRKTISTE